MDLREYDLIVINSSAGKDSQAMLDEMYQEAVKAGVTDRLVVVHADLGNVEWKGTRELAERQAAAYGIRFAVVAKANGETLLQYVERRKMWPSSTARYCTSDFKRGPIRTVFTRLVSEFRAKHALTFSSRKVRILNCMGLRAQESPARAKKQPFEFDQSASNGRREVYNYLPIFNWTTEQVWERIKETGIEHHKAYDLGMPRLSCVFCVFAPKAALITAGKHNAELLDQYIAVEDQIGHLFRKDFSLHEVRDAISAGATVDTVESWSM